MTDLLSALREFRTLEERRVKATLSEVELARWVELRGQLGNHARLLAPPPGIPAAPEPAAAVAPAAAAPPFDGADVEPISSPGPSSLEPPREPLVEAPPEPLGPDPAPPIPIQPLLASRFPSLAAFESETTEARTEVPGEAAEPAERQKTEPGIHLSELPLPQHFDAPAWGPPEVPVAPAIPAAVSMAPVTLKGPVPPLVLDSPIAPARPGDFDSPVTPIVFGEPVATGAPISIAPVDAEAIVESVWRDAGEGEPAPPGSAGVELGPWVAPIPLGSPIAPEVEAEDAGQSGGIPLETVPYPAVRARLKPVRPPEDLPERPELTSEALGIPLELTPAEGLLLPPPPAAEALPLRHFPKPKRGAILLGPSPEQGPLPPDPTIEPPTSEWLPSESLFENRPPPPTPILLQQPTAALDPLDPELNPDDIPAPEPLAKEQLFDTQSTGWLGEHTNEGIVLSSVVRAEVHPPEPARGLAPGEHRVVVHTVAGPLKRGTLHDPDLESGRVDLVLPDGRVENLGVEHIKAIFFMLAPTERPPEPEGSRITVRFKDGRQLSGFCPVGLDNPQGLFILPTDGRSKTARIYVFRSAVKDVAPG